MPTTIHIRDVPDEIHRKAEARAAKEGLTLSDFALKALRKEVERPTLDEMAQRIRALEPVDADRSSEAPPESDSPNQGRVEP